jgi:hypothetical protein
VTAQLLYEIEGPLYAGPDVVTRLDTVRLEVLAPDRVRVSGARGEPPPDRLKVAVNYSGGFRNQVTFVLTGSDVEAKRDVVLAQLFASVPGGRDAFDTVEVQLLPHGDPHAEPVDLWHAQTELRVTVSSHDAQLVGRAFTARAVELTLTSVPGLFLPGPPPQPSPFAVYWPTTVAAAAVQPQCWLLGETGADDELPVPPEPVTPHREPLVRAEPDVVDPDTTGPAAAETRRPGKQMRPVRLPLGALVGARSGDKGGNANLGLWVRHDLPDDLADELYDWLLEVLTPERLRSMVPEAADLRIDRYRLTNLRAVNFVLRGLLGRGVADSVSVDPQGKGLGEYLRARRIEVPAALAARIEAVTSQRDER